MRGSGPHAVPASGPLRSIVARTLSLDSSSGADAPCVEALDYASAMRPIEQLQRLHWVCGPGSGALTIRIGGLKGFL